jgi:hypothetical protein
LNRILGKTYFDESPSVSYVYDIASSYASTPNNTGNFSGRLSYVTTTLADSTVESAKYISSYDADGNVTDDGTNQYLYDAENRPCAVYNYTGSGALTGYFYGGDGKRVGKGPITSWSCDVAANAFSFANIYAVGPSGEQLDETDGSWDLLHSSWHSGRWMVGT